MFDMKWRYLSICIWDTIIDVRCMKRMLISEKMRNAKILKEKWNEFRTHSPK